MRAQNRIGAYQLYALFAVSLLSTVFMTANAETPEAGAAETLLFFLPFTGICAVTALPLLLRRRNKYEIGTVAGAWAEISPRLERPVSAAYAAVFLWAAALAGARFVLFLQSQIFRGDGAAGLLPLLFAAAGFAASRELESLGRTAVLFGVATGAATLLLAVAALPDFDASLLPPIWDAAPASVLTCGLEAAVRAPEILTLAVFAPEVAGRIRRGYGVWLACAALLLPVVFLIPAGVTGTFGAIRGYRFYALAGTVKLGQLERAEDALCATWILCAFLKVAFFLLAAHRSICASFSFKRKFLLYYILSASACAAAFVLVRSPSAFEAATGLAPGLSLLFLFAVALPILPAAVKIAARRKKWRRRSP